MRSWKNLECRNDFTFFILNFTFCIFLTSQAFAATPPLCKVGTVANLVQTGSTWTWECQGKHGGTTAPTTTRCSTGTATAVTTNATTFTWSCNGQYGGTNRNCSA
ncbi:MAG: hypothetical protein FWE93_07070, partial [Alphaproteobacteria bacterium]|nr:hypothetical protein [Alphaproteobacteria bacterium]